MKHTLKSDSNPCRPTVRKLRDDVSAPQHKAMKTKILSNCKWLVAQEVAEIGVCIHRLTGQSIGRLDDQ